MPKIPHVNHLNPRNLERKLVLITIDVTTSLNSSLNFLMKSSKKNKDPLCILKKKKKIFYNN